MIELTEDYDLNMEILCTIPRHPNMAAVRDLTEDFGIDLKTCRSILEPLKLFGVGTCIPQKGEGLHTFINKSRWTRTKESCNRYWDAFYGNGKEDVKGDNNNEQV